MNTELINKAIDAAVEALKVVDGSKADGSKTVLFSGTIESENGVRTVKSVNGDIVSENDVNAIFDRIGTIAKTVVFAIDYARKQSEEKREVEVEATAQETELENKEIDAKIDSLESEIANLKSRKRPVRKLVKKNLFETATHDTL